VRAGYDLTGAAKPVETTAGWMRFRVQVDSKQTATLVVEESRPIAVTYELTNLNSDQIALFVHQQSIDKAVEDALRKLLAQKEVIADLDSQSEARDTEIQTIFDDQQRLRENMKSLKGTAEEKALTQRYTQQLNEQENRPEVLRKEKEQLEAKKDAAQTELNRMIQALSMDVRLS
jgi:chromosome segregation ATPase